MNKIAFAVALQSGRMILAACFARCQALAMPRQQMSRFVYLPIRAEKMELSRNQQRKMRRLYGGQRARQESAFFRELQKICASPPVPVVLPEPRGEFSVGTKDLTCGGRAKLCSIVDDLTSPVRLTRAAGDMRAHTLDPLAKAALCAASFKVDHWPAVAIARIPPALPVSVPATPPAPESPEQRSGFGLPWGVLPHTVEPFPAARL